MQKQQQIFDLRIKEKTSIKGGIMDENRDETTIESKQEHVICGCEEETQASDADAVAKSDEQAEEGILSDYAKRKSRP